eukprot:3046083-Heterocapsa_arctica.AAC.1
MFFTPDAVQGLGAVWAQEVARTDKRGENDKGRGKNARGPVAVVIASLDELGWRENGPDKWIIDGNEYNLRKTSPKLIELMAIATATNNVWKKAAVARRDLGGLQGVVDWTVPRAILKTNDISSPADTATLRNILAGGTWPQTRLAEAVEGTSLLCQSCKSQDEDEFHR